MKTVVSNSLNEEIHERTETNKSNKFSSCEERTIVMRREPQNQKARKAEELTQTVRAAMTTQRVDNIICAEPAAKEAGRERSI